MNSLSVLPTSQVVYQPLLFKFHTLYELRFSDWLINLYHMTLGYDETTSLTSLSWCNSRGVNSIHHGFG